MSHFAVITTTTKQLDRKVSKQVSEYTSGLRGKLDKSTNYQAEYDKMFGGFADRKLAKDDLYYSIKNEIESKEKDAERAKKKKDKKEGKGKNDSLLPVVHENEQ